MKDSQRGRCANKRECINAFLKTGTLLLLKPSLLTYFTIEIAGSQALMSSVCCEKSLPLSFLCPLCVDLLNWEQLGDTNVVLPPQQASYHQEVSEEVRERALRFGTECTLGYLELLEHVLLVSRGLHAHAGSLPMEITSLNFL